MLNVINQNQNEVVMKRICALFVSLVFVLSLAVSPVFAGGGKVQGDNSAQGAEQGDLGKGVSPGDDKMDNQV